MIITESWLKKLSKKLYFIAGSQDKGIDKKPLGANGLLRVLEEALISGIDYYQFRDKGENSLEKNKKAQISLAKNCQNLCEKYNVPFIINDNVDLAINMDADGVHVGQDDEDIDTVIKEMGTNKIIGYTVPNKKKIEQAHNIKGLSYLGLGPVFPTVSKDKKGGFIGLDGLRDIMQEKWDMPIYAIAGINVTNSKDVLTTGVDGICVISAICQSANIKNTVKILKP